MCFYTRVVIALSIKGPSEMFSSWVVTPQGGAPGKHWNETGRLWVTVTWISAINLLTILHIQHKIEQQWDHTSAFSGLFPHLWIIHIGLFFQLLRYICILFRFFCLVPLSFVLISLITYFFVIINLI